MRGLRPIIVLVALLVAVTCPPARAQDPGRWMLTGASSVPVPYWQGLTSDPAGERVFFVGVFEGLWQTTPLLAQTAGVGSAIPPDVKALEGYDHIGDPTWDPAEGGRVLLPLECYRRGWGTLRHGSSALRPRRRSRALLRELDSAEIPKQGADSPTGSSLWTSTPGSAGYGRATSRPPTRAPATAPSSGSAPAGGGAAHRITGAVFRHGGCCWRLGRPGPTSWSVDTDAARVASSRDQPVRESEGLDTIHTLGGRGTG